MSSRLPIFGIVAAACFLLASSPAQAAKTKRVSRNYPVAQILGYMDFTPAANTDKADKNAKSAEEKLIELIVSTVDPDSWKQNGGYGRISYEPVSKSLLVHQSEDAQEQVSELLAALERLMDLQVALEIRLLTISEACFERVGIDFEAVGESEGCERSLQINKVFSETVTTSDGLQTVVPRGYTEVTPTPIQFDKAFLSDSQVRELLEAAQEDRRTNIMQAPKLTMLNGQSGTIKVCETKVFLTDLHCDFSGDKVTCMPKQESIDFGTYFTVMPTVSADRKSILVNLKFKQTDLVGPVPLIPVQIPMKKGKPSKEKSQPFTMFLQQPQVNTLAIENTTRIPEGQTLLLGGIKKSVEGRTEFRPPVLSKIPYVNRLFKTVGYGRESVSLVIMVTPRIIVNEEAEEKSESKALEPAPTKLCLSVPGARTQVRVVQPAGMEVSWYCQGENGTSYSNNPIQVPGRYNFEQGAVYRLRLKGIKNRPGLEVYPTMEVVPTNYKTEAFLAHSSVPVSFSDEDFEEIAEGKQIVKVVYLPNPENQELTGSGAEVISSTQLEPGADPIQEAQRRGSILVVIRMGDQTSHLTPVRVHGGIGP